MKREVVCDRALVLGTEIYCVSSCRKEPVVINNGDLVNLVAFCTQPDFEACPVYSLRSLDVVVRKEKS